MCTSNSEIMLDKIVPANLLNILHAKLYSIYIQSAIIKGCNGDVGSIHSLTCTHRVDTDTGAYSGGGVIGVLKGKEKGEKEGKRANELLKRGVQGQRPFF